MKYKYDHIKVIALKCIDIENEVAEFILAGLLQFKSFLGWGVGGGNIMKFWD